MVGEPSYLANEALYGSAVGRRLRMASHVYLANRLDLKYS
jgi:hypothetical protein